MVSFLFKAPFIIINYTCVIQIFQDLNRYKSNIPHLVTISGRQDSSVARAFEELKAHPIDPEQLALLQSIHQTRTGGHLGRGYAILGKFKDP